MQIFGKKAFAVITTFSNLSYVNSLECISMNNQECKARPKIIDDEPLLEAVAVLMIRILNCVFQMSLKT